MNEAVTFFVFILVSELFLLGVCLIFYCTWKNPFTISPFPLLKKEINNGSVTGFKITSGKSSNSLRVTNNGNEINNIMSISIDLIEPNKLITAKLTVLVDDLDLHIYESS